MPPYKNKPFLAVLIRAVAEAVAEAGAEAGAEAVAEAVAEAYVEYLREGGDPKDIKAFTVHAKNVIGAILHRT